MDMLDYTFIVCMSAALICSVALLCTNFYEKGYNSGYRAGYTSGNTKKKKTSRKR